MGSANICKFPQELPPAELSVFCFVLETLDETMRKEITLPHSRMILVEQGEGDFSFDGVLHPFHAGALLFGFEGERFFLAHGEGVRYLYIDFGGARAAALFHRFGISPRTRMREACHAAIPFCKDCLLHTHQENIDIAAEGVLFYIFSRLSADWSKQNATIQKILDMTEKYFREPSLSIARIAKEIGYSPKYLSHFFKESMQVSYSEYLRSFRFRYAISLFELGISSVKNVALLSGFSDPLYFSGAFKKAIGVSPSEFIRSLAKGGQNEATT